MSTELKVPSHKIAWNPREVDDILRMQRQILESGQVILGKYTAQFEEEFAAYCGRSYGTAVSSDTAAFEIQLRMLKEELKQVGEESRVCVLYPALGFPSILESVRNAGFEPWFVDADIEGHLFATTEMIEQAIADCEKATGEPPAALILMHTGGLLARDSERIVEVCADRQVYVLEDAAHAMGAELNGKRAGSTGFSSAFSLYATKPMHACEGGMIVTDDEETATLAKTYRNYGRMSTFGRSICTVHGYSWRITELQSAVGLVNLRRLDGDLILRRHVMDQYDAMIDGDKPEFLSNCPKLPMSKRMKPNGYRYIRLLPDADADKRGDMKGWIREEFGVDLPGEVYELPSHKQPIWEEEYGHFQMPVAEDFCARHFALPVYASLHETEQELVVEAVEAGLQKFYS